MKRSQGELDHRYTIYGTGAWGACSAIQAKLMEHGVCSYTGWAPSPPDWRFVFYTHLRQVEIVVILGNLLTRHDVRIEK